MVEVTGDVVRPSELWVPSPAITNNVSLSGEGLLFLSNDKLYFHKGAGGVEIVTSTQN